MKRPQQTSVMDHISVHFSSFPSVFDTVVWETGRIGGAENARNDNARKYNARTPKVR